MDESIEIIYLKIPLSDYENQMTQLITTLLEINQKLFPLEDKTSTPKEVTLKELLFTYE